VTEPNDQQSATQVEPDGLLANPVRGVAVHDYKAEAENELSLVKGETVYIVDPDYEQNDWVAGYVLTSDAEKIQGFFPKSFVDVGATTSSEPAAAPTINVEPPVAPVAAPTPELGAQSPRKEESTPGTSTLSKPKQDKHKRRKSSDRPKHVRYYFSVRVIAITNAFL